MNTLCTNAYILEAWISMIEDFGADPFIVFKPSLSERETIVPTEQLNDGCMTLNISTGATKFVIIDKETGYLNVAASFGGVKHDLFIPMETIVNVRSHDNEISFHTPTQLMIVGDPLPSNPELAVVSDIAKEAVSTSKSSKPTLTVVK